MFFGVSRFLSLCVSVILLAALLASALTLKQAVDEALKSNPEILQSAQNREAVEFELRQARGLCLPTLDLVASAGGRKLDSPGRRRLGEEDLAQAQIRFLRLVGLKLGSMKYPPSVSKALPRSAAEAIDIARRQSPRIAAAGADVDAADALARGAKSAYLPVISFEAKARVGNDIDGSEGRTSDLEAKVVARWNLYRGGRDQAVEQERIRRASESRMQNVLIHREVQESIADIQHSL